MTTLSPPTKPPLFTRERLVLVIAAVALFMENMDATIIATSLPAIAADIGTEPLALRIAITSYLVSLAIAIPASGWLVDRFGARNVFRSALVVFMLGSIGCAFADSLTTFVAARIVQGAGGAMMSPIGRLVVARSTSRAQLVSAMAWLTFPALLGPLVGPPVGGFITTFFSWHWIFILNIPFGIAGVLLASRYIDNVRETNPRPFDFRGWILLGLGLAGLAFGFSVLGLAFIPLPVVAALVVGGGAFTTAYVIHARRHPNPVMDLRYLKLPTFRANIAGGTLYRIGAGALPFLLPMMLQLSFNMTPLQAGLVTFATAIGAMPAKPVVSHVLKRYGFRRTLIANGVFSALGLGAAAFFTVDTPYAVMLVVLAISGVFRSLQFTAVNTIAYADIPNNEVSRMTPFASVVQQVGSAAGVAVGALAVELMQFINGHATPQAADFQGAFVVVAIVAMSSILQFRSLPSNAGEELANRSGGSR